MTSETDNGSIVRVNARLNCMSSLWSRLLQESRAGEGHWNAECEASKAAERNGFRLRRIAVSLPRHATPLPSKPTASPLSGTPALLTGQGRPVRSPGPRDHVVLLGGVPALDEEHFNDASSAGHPPGSAIGSPAGAASTGGAAGPRRAPGTVLAAPEVGLHGVNQEHLMEAWGEEKVAVWFDSTFYGGGGPRGPLSSGFRRRALIACSGVQMRRKGITSKARKRAWRRVGRTGPASPDGVYVGWCSHRNSLRAGAPNGPVFSRETLRYQRPTFLAGASCRVVLEPPLNSDVSDARRSLFVILTLNEDAITDWFSGSLGLCVGFVPFRRLPPNN